MIGRWPLRFVGTINAHDMLTQFVNVLHHQGAGGEVVGPFFCHLLLGSVAVVVLAADLRGEDRCTLQESTTC